MFLTTCLIFATAFPFIANSQITTYNAGQAFTCIAVDSNYNIWAGTSKTGLYLLDKKANASASQFTIASSGSLSTYNIQTLAADQYSNVWVGHSGLGSSTCAGGGIEQINMNNPSIIKHYSPDANAECLTFSKRDGLATRNSASIAVDKNGTIWSAHKYDDLTILDLSNSHFIVTPGSLSYKFASSVNFYSKGTYEDFKNRTDGDLPYPAYTCDAPISKTPGSRNTYAVACGNDETWLSVASYEAKNGTFYPARLLRYNSAGTFVKAYDFASIGFTAGGIFNGIWVTPKGDVWATLSLGKGFAVFKKGSWQVLDFKSLTCIFPAGTLINTNAVWGNKLGQVFIGTNNGLIVYNGLGPVHSVSSYSFYNSANGALIGNNIIAGVSEKDTIQWIVTDKGIMSSDLGRNYPSTDEKDYTSCGNEEINAIERQSMQDLSYREDYHIYRLETEVCTVSGPNGKNCNAQYVYDMMKEDVSLTAPSPENFPFDNLSPNLLRKVTKDELKEMVSNVNAWQSSSGQIKYISDILTPSQKEKAASDYSIFKARLPFAEALDAVGRQHEIEVQKSINPKKVISCNQEYLLYNSPNFIFDRAFYDVTLDLAVCDNKLRSPEYDPVLIFTDDKNLTITNYAVNGHILNPGKIVRSVIEECGKVKIVTIGSGLNYCGNNLIGKINGNGNVIGGSVIFKNIDFKLKTAFEGAK